MPGIVNTELSSGMQEARGVKNLTPQQVAAEVVGALARIADAGEEAEVEWLSGRQQWAIRVCVEAGLRLDAEEGCVFTGGDVGPFSPYLPSGAYL
jgi:hypothetical protein